MFFLIWRIVFTFNVKLDWEEKSIHEKSLVAHVA